MHNAIAILTEIEKPDAGFGRALAQACCQAWLASPQGAYTPRYSDKGHG